MLWNCTQLCQQIWKSKQWPQDWKRSVLIPIPKKGNDKEHSDYCIIALISHTSKVMLKILQMRLQQYVNLELPDVQAGFRKGRGTRDQIANIHWITERAREFQKNIYSCFIDYAKEFDCVDHSKLWKILQENTRPPYLPIGLPWWTQMVKRLPAMWETWVRTLGQEDPRRRKWQPTPVLLPGKFHGWRSLVGYSPWSHKKSDTTEWLHFTCLLKNLYAGQEATLRTGHGTMDWFQLGKEYFKAVYCHPAYLTSMQSISCEMLGWMKYKLESKLPGRISITSEMQMISPL